ncbi:hypothetical protein L1987_47184 [Smallanthus sonchifolius]|uniref:Uncharacterized protein n=1 Tax=Smallanthus sonchifolius TaxID=185202 RepID=A0ACB9G178_9ASTR|nr:hypothetical protein L1987_47184 [Smallanthus sonchifolius]
MSSLMPETPNRKENSPNRGFENTKWHHLDCFFPLDADLVSVHLCRVEGELSGSCLFLLGLKTQFLWGFIKKCEDLFLFLVSDSRFVGYQPWVLATAAMLHVLDQVDHFNCANYLG